MREKRDRQPLVDAARLTAFGRPVSHTGLHTVTEDRRQPQWFCVSSVFLQCFFCGPGSVSCCPATLSRSLLRQGGAGRMADFKLMLYGLRRSEGLPPAAASRLTAGGRLVRLGPRDPRTIDYGRTVTFVILTGVMGRLIAPSAPIVVGTLASASTTSMPEVTRAKIT